MENLVPQKILGKKFVRGKPYYKVRWEGLSKDQSTWQPPTKFLQYKSMINKYQVKNWGCPLDTKFFDPSLYSTKPTVQKKTEKKKIKAIKRERKKNEEIDSESPDESPAQEGAEEEEQAKEVGKNKEIQKKPEANEKAQKNQTHLEIIDIESEQNLPAQESFQKEEGEPCKQQKIPKKKEKKQTKVGNRAPPEKVKQLKEKFSDKNQISILEVKQKNKFTLPQIETKQKLPSKQIVIVPQKNKKQLFMTNMINLQIMPMKKIHQITHIYHLEKMNIGNHLYLVEFQDKEMRKMTTKDLMEQHSQQFVNYLEKRYRIKYNP